MTMYLDGKKTLTDDIDLSFGDIILDHTTHANPNGVINAG